MSPMRQKSHNCPANPILPLFSLHSRPTSPSIFYHHPHPHTRSFTHSLSCPLLHSPPLPGPSSLFFTSIFVNTFFIFDRSSLFLFQPSISSPLSPPCRLRLRPQTPPLWSGGETSTISSLNSTSYLPESHSTHHAGQAKGRDPIPPLCFHDLI
jgi:hypothetical protein